MRVRQQAEPRTKAWRILITAAELRTKCPWEFRLSFFKILNLNKNIWRIGLCANKAQGCRKESPRAAHQVLLKIFLSQGRPSWFSGLEPIVLKMTLLSQVSNKHSPEKCPCETIHRETPQCLRISLICATPQALSGPALLTVNPG